MTWLLHKISWRSPPLNRRVSSGLLLGLLLGVGFAVRYAFGGRARGATSGSAGADVAPTDASADDPIAGGRSGLLPDITAIEDRRARKLLPVLFALVGGSLLYTALFQPEEVSSLRGDALASLGHVSNWHLVFEDQSYFEALARPSLLRHLWSLAVEEQFYVFFLLTALAWLDTRRSGRRCGDTR